MNIPDFTAEASLYRTSNSYRPLAFDRVSPQRAVVIPQRGGPGFEGFWACVQDCKDENPGWTTRECQAACRDVGGPGGPPPPADPTNRDLSIAGCWAWWAACKINPFSFGCDEVRDRCLADI